MIAYQFVDKATVELIDKLLDAGVLQLILILPIVTVILLLAYTVFDFLRKRRDQNNQDSQRAKESEADNTIINRMIDIADKANTNTAALTKAIDALNDTQREARTIHQANRDSILAQQDAVNALVINVQNLGRQQLTWSKLVDDNLNALDGTLKNLRMDLQQLSSEVQHLQTLAENPALQSHLDSVLKAMAKDMLSKLDAILSRLPKDPPPTPPGNEAEPPVERKPTKADGAEHHATVDFTPDELPRTGTDG